MINFACDTYTLKQFQAVDEIKDLIEIFNLQYQLNRPIYPIFEVQQLSIQDKGLWLEFSEQRSGYFWCLSLIDNTRYVTLKCGQICKLSQLKSFKWIEN